MLDVSGVASGRRFEEQHVYFIVRSRSVLDTPRDDEEFTFGEGHDAVSKLDTECSTHDEKELVLVLMMMPDELALEFDKLHLLPVQLTDDFGPPVISDLRQLLGEIDFVHDGYQLVATRA